MKDKISIIIPTYNRGKLISKSIDSAINQTYKNIEIIIVDDGSTDNTESIIKKIKDDRIIYHKYKNNKGACHARNYGINKSTGKYICFLDSDDTISLDKIEKQYNNLIKNNSDIDICKVKRICDGNSFIFPNKEQEKSIINNNVLNEICKGNFIGTESILIKKSIIEKESFDEEMPRLQDFELFLRVFSKIKKVSYTNEALINYYVQKDSISNNHDKLKDAVYIILNKKYNFTEEQRNNLYKQLINLISSDIHNQDMFIYNNLLNDYNNIKNNDKFIIESKDLLINNLNKIIIEKDKVIKDNKRFIKIINKNNNNDIKIENDNSCLILDNYKIHNKYKKHVNWSIDNIDSKELYIRGYIFYDDDNHYKYKRYIILKNNNYYYKIGTQYEERHDVAIAFPKITNIINTGFRCDLNNDIFNNNNEYEIIIHLENVYNKNDYVDIITNMYIKKDSN